MLRIVVITILVLLATGALAGYLLINDRIGAEAENFEIRVRPSDTAADVRNKLIAEGADIKSPVYSILMVLTGTDRQIHPGKYKLSGNLTHWDLMDYFREGRVELSRVTIPEGLPLWKVIPILAAGVPTDSIRLAELLNDSIFFSEFDIEGPGFEGYLFPETYTFFAEESPRNVISQMVGMFKVVYGQVEQTRAEELGMTLNEVVTLASLIEAEASDGAERELISSVFHNRLKAGWLLQCDPTVIFALGGLDRPLWKRDLDFASPYNTYLHPGLPPGPICSPGRASLEAALFPAESDYYYFVADGQGKHIFSRTLREHNRANEAVKRKERSRG